MAALGHGLVSRAAIHLIEAGKSRPSLSLLKVIATRTGESIDYFIDPRVGLNQSDGADPTRQMAEHLRLALAQLTRLLRVGKLRTSEREALLLLAASLRQGIRLLSAVSSSSLEKQTRLRPTPRRTAKAS
jgi:transcriptional regulator with XRE-family HTH domain